MIDGKTIKEIVKKFAQMEGVRGVIITDKEGLPIQSDLDTETTENVSAHITSLVGRSKMVVDALQEGGLKFLRLETNKGEVMVAPDDAGLILIVLK
ncbi:MAG TPA: roadblock/LC7 domain-containing protein [Candidatus Lokiarchaeia archaeon]|nr:roadblock/LC7 domain-containing protein [Candidatus Lokiarchaeia archaeon]